MAALECNFCAVMKIRKFNTTATPNINGNVAEKVRREKKLRKIMKGLIMLLGHGERTTSVPDAVAKLMVRNYPELVDWKGDNKLVIFVPEFYLNKAIKYVDPEKGATKLKYCKEVIESKPE